MNTEPVRFVIEVPYNKASLVMKYAIKAGASIYPYNEPNKEKRQLIVPGIEDVK